MTNCVCSFPAPSPAQWSCFAGLQTTITLLPNIRIQTVFANTAWTINTPAGGSSALSRVTLCGGGCQVAQIWSPHTGACKQCHVWSPGHWDSWDTPPAYLHISPHISTYLHVSAVSAAVSLSPVSTQIRRHLTRHCSHRGDTEHCSTALQNFYYNGTIEY